MVRGTMTPATVRDVVEECLPEIVEVRRILHAHPELSFEERETTGLIRDRLRTLGADELRCPTETGAVFSIDGGTPGRTVLLRADIDALPVHEQTDLPFRSRIDGVMHACGHDAHTAVLLGVARAIAARSAALPGRYVFLFQPAEEQLSGARAMIEGGVLDAFRAERVIGCHIASSLPSGRVFLRPGIALADAQGLRFELRGAGGHGAFPGQPGNVIAALAELIRGLPSAVHGLEHEGVPCACSAGVVRGGTALNVLPSSALVEGTLRTFTEPQKREAVDRLHDLCRQVGTRFGVAAHLTLTVHAPPVVNDAAASEVVRAAAERSLGADLVVRSPPFPPSDDVSEFLDRVPGVYFFVGAARHDGASGMHHSPTFDIEEEALRAAALVMADGAVALATGA